MKDTGIGTDGRFYDDRFDFNQDGKLDIYEKSMYDKAFNENYIEKSKGQNPFTLLYSCGVIPGIISSIIWAIGFLLMIICPPLGAALIIIAVTISERF